FSLVVNDSHINSAADSVTIKVNCVPVANAGPDQFINQPATLITLDGSASSDANLDPLTYAWTQTAGPAVVLSNPAAVGPTFTPVSPGTYTFSLIVNDGIINSAADTVTITVNAVPVANAGPDQLVIQPGVLVTLDGSASADADGDPITYAWAQTSGAAVVLSSNIAQSPTFTPAVCGNYVFSLVVNDTHINSAADSVAIRINCVPVANAGPDQAIPSPGVLVTLDGSGSSDADSDPLTYAWTQTGGAAVVLSNPAAVSPTFTPTLAGVYTFQLIVNDGHINSAADFVIIATNFPPVADAGPDQLIIQPSVLVTLDGSVSSDANLDPLTYAWTQTSGAAVVLSSATAQKPTFTPATCGNYIFSLVVNDGQIDSPADSVVIRINCVPVANAGPDQAPTAPGSLITLDGSASADADGDPLTYAWTQTSGAAVVLSSNTAQKPTFTPATCDTYTFSLVVNDTHINSAADSVTIKVNCVPVANAGSDQFINQPATLITLDGSVSSDANLDPLTYAWTQIAGPAVILSSAASVGPTFTPASPGTYTFSLIVNDGIINSFPDTVTIIVNTVPVANAGPDQLVIQPGVLVALDGSASADADGDPITYAWTQTSGAAVVLSSNTAQSPTFTPVACGNYTFSLVVNDTHINSAADSVAIRINCVPVANAGADQAIPSPGVLVTLNGSGSSDADGDPLTYAWTQTSGPAVIVLSNPAAQNPTFTPPVAGAYIFQLTVNDGHINSAADSVVISTNFPPVADAGPDQLVIQPGVLATLDGSASSDANLDPLTYAWTQTGGAAVVLSSATAQKPTFTPVACGNYTFSLIVNDGQIDSPADSVLIRINCVPVANAGPDQLIIQPSVLVTLDGSASSDADGDPLTYAWTQTGGPAAVLSSNTAQQPTFTPALPGTYIFNLVVNDGHINSAADTVTIVVNTVPVANAGLNQSMPLPNLLVTLDGSASSDADGDPLTYAWTQISGPAVVTLSSSTAVNPTFTPTAGGAYVFQLIVNDGHIDSAPDTVQINVNLAPVANAGPDQFINQPGTLVTLDGSASADPLGDPITYLWTQTSGPAAALSNSTIVNPTFTPGAPGVYVFQLVVNDGIVNSPADTVTITVNTVPVANAGPDQLVIQPAILITLDGSASADADGDPITYAWTQTGGAAVTLSSNTAQQPTFTPAAPGIYTFNLIVNDSHINSPADTVVITVNTVPVANAGPDQSIAQPGLLVTLDGSASSDADGDPITYAWTQTSGPAALLSSATAQKPTFTPALPGTYIFQLIVNDGLINSAPDSVTVIINTVPVANAGPDQIIIQPGLLVTLDGSASADADGDPLTYAWTQTSGAAVVLSSNTAQKPTFTPASCGNYVFSLIVNDSHINSPADSVTIRVNCVPIADAGPDQAIPSPGVLVTLDGSGSSDADSDPLTYAWTQTGGPAVVVLSNPAAVNPTFTPPVGGTYTFQLIVNDGFVDSVADTVTIATNFPPVANAGSDQLVIQPGILAALDGSASSDANGDPLTYAWTQTSGLAVVLSSNTAVNPAFTPAVGGTYVFSLTVNDGYTDSIPDTVTIRVNFVPVANAGPDQFITAPGLTVTLDGSASSDTDLDPLTYAWTQTGGAPVVLSSATSINPTFTPVSGGTYIFSLIVNDGHINSPSDTVVITINNLPVADAGPDQIIPMTSILVTLDGSASSDADGDPITYSWTQTSGPAVTITGANTSNPTFTPTINTTYTFQLIVNDGFANSAADTVSIRVNKRPDADAGANLTAQTGLPVTLDGSGSSDADGDPLTYSWTQIAGPAVAISNPTAVTTTFTPSVPGIYTFQLIVNDGYVDSLPDTVDYDIFAAPNPPTSLVLTTPAPKTIVINWTPPTTNTDGSPLTNLAGYNVYRSSTSGGPYTLVTTVGVTATYTETNVKPYKTFCYVLQTITSSVPQGRSVYSMEVCGSTQPAPYVFKTQCGNPNEPGNVVPATTPGYFNRPSGIALDGAGFVFIADTENNRVQKFTTSCAYVSMWGGVGTANGKFVKPGGIVYNPTNSYVYVADGYNRVQYFTTTGVYVGKFTVAGPLSIAVDSAGNLWITNRSGLVYQYTSAGVLMNTFNSNGASGVDIKPSTGLIIGDAFNNKIGYYSTAGALLNAVGGTGSTTGLFNSPYGVSGDNSGNTYVADSLNNRVQVLDSVYDPINVIGSYGYSAGQMINPKDIDVDSAGSVYVLDQYNNRLQIYDAP
ncbi:MAG: PKD domain-containing protein, partial [bacterium]